MARTANLSASATRGLAPTPRSSLAVAVLALVVALTPSSSAASAPLPAPFVTSEITALTDLFRPTARQRLTPASSARAYLRLLAILDSLDALSPTASLAALEALSTAATSPGSPRESNPPLDLSDLAAARASLEAAIRRDAPAPLGLAEQALVSAVVDPTGDLLGRHAALVAAGVAGLTPADPTHSSSVPPDPSRSTPAPADPSRSTPAPADPTPSAPAPADPGAGLRWARTSRGPVGALALDPFVPSATASEAVFLHVALVFEVDTPFRGALRLGATGDLAATLAPLGDPRSADLRSLPLGEARALQRGVLDQLAVPLELAPGRYALLVTLRPNRSEPALLRARLDPLGPSVPNEPSFVPRPVSVDRLVWDPRLADRPRALVDNPAVQALGDSLEATQLRRLLGLPDLAPSARAPHPPLEDRLAKTLATLTPTSLLVALASVTKDEDRASLLLAASLTSGRSALLLAAQAELASQRGQWAAARLALDEAVTLTQPPASRALALADVLRLVDARLARLAHTPEGALIAYGLAAPDLDVAQAVALTAHLAERDRVELAQAALELGRADLAVSLYDALFTDCPGRLDYQLALARAAEAAGLTDRAIALSIAAADRRPDRPSLALEAARKLVARARPADEAEARRLIALALSGLAPRPDARVMAARLLESLGDRPAAARALTEVLVADPSHADARRNLERLVGAEPIPLTLTLAEVASAPILDPDQSFEVLGEELFVQLRADGSATRWTRRILRAQSVPEQRDAKTLRVRFDPTQESVRVLGAYVHRPGPGPTPGFDTRPVPDRLLQSISEDWYGLYYDLRQLAVPFDHIQRGDLLEVTWRSDAVGQLFPGVVDLFEVLSDRVPKHLQRIVVDAPPGLALTTRLSRPPGARFTAEESTVRRPGGGTRHTLVARDLPALPAEGAAPGAAELAPVWQATTFRSWREVALWYRRLIEPQRVLSPAMKAFVAEVVASGQASPGPGRPGPAKATPGEVLTRLFDYVTREVRYVGLEFGIHGVKPYRSDLVWSRRFGDCKDKATLLSVLLAEAGLRGEVTLVRTRKQGRLEGALPSLSLFDHAVVWLPTRDELIDPTALHFGLGELPRDDQGAQILVLGRPEDPLELAISKVDPPARNGVSGTWIVTVDPRGRAGIQGTVSFLGTQAPFYRALLLDPAAQSQRLAELMNRRYPGLSLREFRVSPPTDRSRPFDLVFHAEVPVLAQVDGGRLIIPRPTGLDGQVDRFATAEARALPLLLGPPMRFAVTYRYVLPEGFRARELPAGGAGEGPFGAYRVTWIDEGTVISVNAELTYAVDQVEPRDYPGLRDFVRGFDAVIAAPLVVERPSPSAAPAPPAPNAPQPTPASPAPSAPQPTPASPAPSAPPTPEAP